MIFQRKNKLNTPVSDTDHVQGRLDAPIVLTLYGDFECPYTRIARNNIKTWQKKFGDDLTIVYRHYPMNDRHENAARAAEAAEAAAAQGKFWQMYDTLFRYQDRLTDADLSRYAIQLDLDTAQFEAEMAANRYTAKIEDQHADAEKSGVHITPTFFVNGTKRKGFHDENILPHLEDVLKG